MAEKKGGTVGKLWTGHGVRYYVAVVVCSFLYLEITDLVSSIRNSEDVPDFVFGELMTLGIETLFNSFLASIWPIYWFNQAGWVALAAAAGGYFIWTMILAVVLSRREKEFRKELGL